MKPDRNIGLDIDLDLAQSADSSHVPRFNDESIYVPTIRVGRDTLLSMLSNASMNKVMLMGRNVYCVREWNFPYLGFLLADAHRARASCSAIINPRNVPIEIFHNYQRSAIPPWLSLSGHLNCRHCHCVTKITYSCPCVILSLTLSLMMLYWVSAVPL